MEQEMPKAGGFAKADITKRVVAAVIDALIGVVVGMIPWLGGVISAAYWLVRDGLDIEFMDRRSLGKKVMKLRPVTLDGANLDMGTSVRRNWPFAFGGIAQVLLFIPTLGWLFLIPVGLIALVVGLIEAFLVITNADGRRMGDRFANTVVIETEDGS